MIGQIFIDKVYKINYSQAKFQIQVVCYLNKQENNEALRDDCALMLLEKNSGLKRNLTHWRNSCPVWKVLGGKQMIVIDDDKVRLNTNLTPSQKGEISKYCGGILN